MGKAGEIVVFILVFGFLCVWGGGMVVELHGFVLGKVSLGSLRRRHSDIELSVELLGQVRT